MAKKLKDILESVTTRTHAQTKRDLVESTHAEYTDKLKEIIKFLEEDVLSYMDRTIDEDMFDFIDSLDSRMMNIIEETSVASVQNTEIKFKSKKKNEEEDEEDEDEELEESVSPKLLNKLKKLGFTEVDQNTKTVVAKDIETLYGIKMRAGAYADTFFAAIKGNKYRMITKDGNIKFTSESDAISTLEILDDGGSL